MGQYIDKVNVNCEDQTLKILSMFKCDRWRKDFSWEDVPLENYEFTLDQNVYKATIGALHMIIDAEMNLDFNPIDMAAVSSMNGLASSIFAMMVASFIDYELGKVDIIDMDLLKEKFVDFVSHFNRKEQDQSPLEIEREIDTSQLCVGLVVKSYKELCKLLDQDVKTGNSKKLQLEMFQRYFAWEKDKQKFIITDIYEVPIQKEDKRLYGNHSVYVKFIELILCQYLVNQPNYTSILTRRNLWEILGMVNEKYNKIEDEEIKKTHYEITSYDIKNFYRRSANKLNKILKTALENLQKRKIIRYEEEVIYVTEDGQHKLVEDDYEKKCLLMAENYALTKVVGFETITDVFLHNKQNEYYSAVNKYLSDNFCWKYTYNRIKLIYLQDKIREVIPQVELQLQKALLSDHIAGYLDKEALNLYYKNLNNPKWKYTYTYVKAQQLLSNELIRNSFDGKIDSFSELSQQNMKEIDDLFDLY